MTVTTLQLFSVHARVEPDETDERILTERVLALNINAGPRVGDFVRYSFDKLHRISHVWEGCAADGSGQCQTSAGGSYYLGDGYVSMWGRLDPGVPASELQLSDEVGYGEVWFFHHDWHRAANAVGARIPFRVYVWTGSVAR